MEDKPLTKSQRRRRNERHRKELQRLCYAEFGPPPELSPELKKRLGSNIGNTAPAHVMECGENYPRVNKGKMISLSNAAADRRKEVSQERRSDLMCRYTRWWDKPRGAKKIAEAEAKLGDDISERTLRHYFRLTRKK